MATFDTRNKSIDNAILDCSDERGDKKIVRTGTNGVNIYVFYVDSTSDLVYNKSTDSGKTWTGATIIEGTDAYFSVSVWYDRWTIGDTTGDLIHIAAVDSSNLELTYFVLDTSDDSAGTNDNTVIDTAATVITPLSAGQVTMCKGKDGDIHCGYTITTTAGFYTFFSEDAGATWTATTGGDNPTTSFSQNSTYGIMRPLDTDNDIILIGRTSTYAGSYFIWDAVGETWTLTEKFFQGFASLGNSNNGILQITQDKSNGDCYIVWCMHSETTYIVHWKFNESTRTMENTSFITFDMMSTATTDLGPLQIRSVEICRNQTTGQLCVVYIFGTLANLEIPIMVFSSDDGKHWSAPLKVQGQLWSDDISQLSMPMIMDSVDGYGCNWQKVYGSLGW